MRFCVLHFKESGNGKKSNLLLKRNGDLDFWYEERDWNGQMCLGAEFV